MSEATEVKKNELQTVEDKLNEMNENEDAVEETEEVKALTNTRKERKLQIRLIIYIQFLTFISFS